MEIVPFLLPTRKGNYEEAMKIKITPYLQHDVSFVG
jgi:hypothetical protein